MAKLTRGINSRLRLAGLPGALIGTEPDIGALFQKIDGWIFEDELEKARQQRRPFNDYAHMGAQHVRG